MGPAVVAGLDPGGEQPVEFLEGGQLVVGDLDQELGADGRGEPFDLPPSLRPSTAQMRWSWWDTNGLPLST
jgi:hypothetical protein